MIILSACSIVCIHINNTVSGSILLVVFQKIHGTLLSSVVVGCNWLDNLVRRWGKDIYEHDVIKVWIGDKSMLRSKMDFTAKPRDQFSQCWGSNYRMDNWCSRTRIEVLNYWVHWPRWRWWAVCPLRNRCWRTACSVQYDPSARYRQRPPRAACWFAKYPLTFLWLWPFQRGF